MLGVSATGELVNSATGMLEPTTVNAVSLANTDGIVYMLTNAVDNFTGFAPLGVVLVVFGTKFCNSPLSLRGKYASIPTLSKVWQYIPVVVAGVGMIIFELEQVFQHIESLFVKDDENKEVA